MIKRLLAIVLTFMMMTGCAGLTLNQELALLTAIEMGAYNAGYYVAKSKTDLDDTAIATFYNGARKGEFDMAKINKTLADLKIEAPQLSGTLMILLKNMGAEIDPTTGGLLSLTKIPLKYWDKAAEGYVIGYDFGLVGKKDITRKVSAVAALIPKK